jgi:hypothetical protein
MPDIFRLMIVEDNDDMFETYQDAADEYSDETTIIEVVRKENADEALEALLSKDFDGAIVDLNLSRSEPDEASGNKVIEEVFNKHRFPIFVVSGNLENLYPHFRAKESDFFKFFNRDTPNEEIFIPFLKVFKTGITKILGGRGVIEKRLGEIFWSHLANNFNIWSDEESNVEKILLRYTVSHLGEYLDMPDGESRFYHQAEFYIKPPIKEYIASGDIISINGHKYINLSPACDVDVRDVIEGKPIINANRVVVAPLVKIDRASFISEGLIKEGDGKKARNKVVEDIIKGKRDRFSFLPEYVDIEASLIDFQNVHAFSFEDIDLSQRIATVSGLFLKDIQSRFSAYYGRQGQPDLDKASLIQNCQLLLAPE